MTRTIIDSRDFTEHERKAAQTYLDQWKARGHHVEIYPKVWGYTFGWAISVFAK